MKAALFFIAATALEWAVAWLIGATAAHLHY
jgi:hypothetical protein